MTRQLLMKINAIAFLVCLASIVCAVVVALFGIWGVMNRADDHFLRFLESCGALFIGAVFTSLAIRCFRTNDHLLPAEAA